MSTPEILARPTTVRLESEAATRVFAGATGRVLPPGSLVVLDGELGSGKTAWVRYLVESMGGLDPVASPTYTLEHEYRVSNGRVVDHWDLYRVHELPPELEEPVPARVIRCVEWGGKFAELAARAELHLSFAAEPDGIHRIVTLRGPHARMVVDAFDASDER